MTVRRRLAAWAVVAGCLLVGTRADAGDGPAGKVVADVLPVGCRVHQPEQVLNFVHTRPGKAYDEGVVQEDVRRLLATKWFASDGVQIQTKAEADGRVTVFIVLKELSGLVSDIQFPGAQHLGVSELTRLVGVRKGDPMNPMANEIGRAAIRQKYIDDGRYYATVDLEEGGKASDTRVVYRIVEGPVIKVAGVEFRGNVRADSGRLKTQLVTSREVAGFIGGKFNPASVDEDRKKLLDYYHALGYLRATVEPEVVRSADLGHVTIAYHISEGPQFTVAARQFDGNNSVPTSKFEEITKLKAGERYDRRQAQADMNLMRDYYGMRGYPVGIDEKLYEVPGQPGVVRVHYEVQGDGGRPSRVGRVIIEGNEVTQDRVILNQIDLRPGQILQYPKLEEGRQRLARLGIFDNDLPPTVDVVPNDFDAEFQDVKVGVHETRTGQVVLGVGVNSNAGLNGNFAINEKNFDLFRLPTSWDDFRYGRAFRGAGQELRLEASPGTQFQRYSATLREPYLFDTQFGLTNSGYYYSRGFAEYNENRYGGRVTLDRRLDPIWRASAATRVEGVQVSQVPFFAPASIQEYAGGHFLLGLRGGLTRDTRDSYLYPTRGSIIDFGVEQVLGDYAFPVGTAEYTQFLSTRFLQREDGSGRHVLGMRSQLSVAGGNAPVYERFYAGGLRSLRGFSFRGVGPFENGYAVGGTFSFLNSIEYQIPLTASDKVFFVTFLDHGTVEKDVSIKNYRVSAGFGFRVAVPALGPLPIAFDFGFPIVRGPYDHKQVFSFSMGLFGGPN